MGLLSGSLNCVRYRVSGTTSRNQLGDFGDAVRRYGFREPSEESMATRTLGWVSVHDAFSSGFEGDSYRMGDRFVLSLRIDERKVSPRLLRHHLKKAEGASREKLGKKFLSKSERTAVKLQVLQGLLQRTLPSVSVYDMLWLPRDSWLVFSGTSEAARREFEPLFEKTFGLRLVREIPYTAMERLLPSGSSRSMEHLRPSVFFS